MAAPFPHTGTSTDALRERAMNAVAVSDETASWRELDRRLREGDKFPSAWSSSVRLRRFREAMRRADTDPAEKLRIERIWLDAVEGDLHGYGEAYAQGFARGCHDAVSVLDLTCHTENMRLSPDEIPSAGLMPMDAATRRHWLAGYASGMCSEACREV